METRDDILREMRTLGRLDEKSTDKIPRSLQALGLRTYADRLEAALKREADSIHRAMVLIAGIEMEDSENPPRLWTALEDAYDALSDALGTDGDTTADVEEAKATGRHFVVKPSGNAAKMRDALKYLRDASREFCHLILNSKHNEIYDKYKYKEVAKISDTIVNANFILAAPARNCDVHQTKDRLLKAIHDDRGYLRDPIKERESVVDFVLAEAADVKQNLTTAEAKGEEK